MGKLGEIRWQSILWHINVIWRAQFNDSFNTFVIVSPILAGNQAISYKSCWDLKCSSHLPGGTFLPFWSTSDQSSWQVPLDVLVLCDIINVQKQGTSLLVWKVWLHLAVVGNCYFFFSQRNYVKQWRFPQKLCFIFVSFHLVYCELLICTKCSWFLLILTTSISMTIGKFQFHHSHPQFL